MDPPAGLEPKIFSSRLKNSNVKVTGNDFCHAGAWPGLARLEADEGQVVKDAAWDVIGDGAAYFAKGWMRNSSDPSINCHE